MGDEEEDRDDLPLGEWRRGAPSTAPPSRGRGRKLGASGFRVGGGRQRHIRAPRKVFRLSSFHAANVQRRSILRRRIRLRPRPQ